MGLQGQYIDKRRKNEAITAYYVCEGAARVDYKNGTLHPLFSCYADRDAYKNGEPALEYKVSAEQLFKDEPKAYEPEKTVRFTFDKKAPSIDQIYQKVKEYPKAAAMSNVLEEGQSSAK